jgi:hypothetical protein
MGHFNEEALRKFNVMCSEGVEFSEGDSYDFARCIMPDGSIYGTKGQCKLGKPLKDKENGGESKTKSRMSKLKREFMKKLGREMRPNEVAKAQNMLGIGVPIPKGQSAEDVLQQLLPKGEKVIPVKSA